MSRLATAAMLVFLFAGVSPASAATDKLPNITPFPARDLTVQTASDGSRHLRFTTLSWNKGVGALEIRGGTVDAANGKQEVRQRIYATDGTYRHVSAGWFVWHADHGHIHFNDYALYTLQPVTANGASSRISAKTTFCIMDTTKVNTQLPGAPKKKRYSTCGATVQGMSVGWGDRYGYTLSGQSINITGLPNGDYNLKIEIDPKAQLVESNDADNVSNLRVRLYNGSVTVV